MPRTDYEARVEARKERLEDRADRHAVHSSKDITDAIELLQAIKTSVPPADHFSCSGEYISKLTIAIDCLDDCLCEANEREEAEMDEARRLDEDGITLWYDKYTGSGAGR